MQRVSDPPTYTLSTLHVLLAHLNQDYIRYMVRHDFLSSNPSSIFDLSGSIDCASCRTFKSQAQAMPHKSSIRRRPESTLLSDIPVDLQSSADLTSRTHDLLFRVHIDGFEFHFQNSIKCFYIYTDEGTDFKMVYFVKDKTAESFLTTLQTFHALKQISRPLEQTMVQKCQARSFMIMLDLTTSTYNAAHHIIIIKTDLPNGL